MGTNWSSVVITDFEYPDDFQLWLLFTLDRLGSSIRMFTTWSEGLGALLSLGERCHLLVADCTAATFDGPGLLAALGRVGESLRPDLVLVADAPQSELTRLEENYGALAAVTRQYSAEQLDFVLGRLFFPIGMCKRAHPRALASVDVEWMDFQRLVFRREKTFNLSQSGIYVWTPRPEEPGRFLELMLDLGDEPDPVQCSGRVVYTRDSKSPCRSSPAACRRPAHQRVSEVTGRVHCPDGMAVQIKGIDERDRLRLSLFVEDRLIRADRLNLAIRGASNPPGSA